jgi:hypothetical protein
MIESKSLLAKLMATENLTIEQRKVTTASFNVKERILTIPFLDNKISASIMDLFMGHEVGHALYTPLEGLIAAKEKKLVASVLNVVEDSRIERKIKSKYPGLKNSFVKAYNELVEKDFFGTKGKDINTLNFIDRVNLHCKGGATLAIKFTDDERQLLQAVESTEKWEDVEEVTKRIIDYMKSQQEEEKKRRDSSKDEDVYEDEFEEIEQLEDGDDFENLEEEGNFGDSTEKITEEDEDYESDVLEEPTYNGTEGGSDEEIRAHTDDAYRANESKLFSADNMHFVYMNIPKFDIKKGIWDYKSLYQKYIDENYTVDKKHFIKFRQESSKVVSYLVKEFELRKNAEQLKRANISKTGELNLNKIFSYQFSEDIFKKVTVVPGGKSHGLIMYLDWSGSMSQHIGNTIKQLLNLVMFCKKVNIPFEVYAFIDDTEPEYIYKIKPKIGDVQTDPFCLLNILSNRMSAAEFMTAGGILMHISGIGSRRTHNYPYFMRMGGTPLNEAVISAMEIVPDFQKKNKLQIVNTVFLTDGDGSYLNSSYSSSEGHRNSFKDNKPRDTTSRIIFRDTVTKHEQSYDDDFRNYSSMRMQQTSTLIKLLKLRTNSHVIGFFVGGARDIRTRMSDFYPGSSFYDIERKKEEFRKSKYLVVNSTGFDDYYILRSNGLDTDEDAELEVKENVTTRGLVSAFNKYAGNRINNRVILNRFIGLIS